MIENFKNFLNESKNDLNQYIKLQRGQFGKIDSIWDLNASDGQHGKGVYCFYANDNKMIKYYTNEGEILHTFYIPLKELFKVSKNVDYWQAKEIMYKNDNFKAFEFIHKGVGIPTSKEIVITDNSIIKLENEI